MLLEACTLLRQFWRRKENTVRTIRLFLLIMLVATVSAMATQSGGSIIGPSTQGQDSIGGSNSIDVVYKITCSDGRTAYCAGGFEGCLEYCASYCGEICVYEGEPQAD